MTPVPVIELTGVTRVLPGPPPVTLVRGVDLTVAAGDFVAVTGPSGSGKSSLLYLMGLLDRPTSGAVRLRGRDTSGLDEAELARLRLEDLGFVFQFHFLLPELSVIDNVTLPMRRLRRLSNGEMAARGRDLLDRFGIADQMSKYPHQLSGGQLQRVALARALANDPPLLLADEPTGNLDTANAEQVFALLEDLTAAGARSVVVITHEPELAARAGRRVHIVDGRIVDGGEQ